MNDPETDGATGPNEINVADANEVASWAENLGVTTTRLKNAVAEVGTKLDDVAIELGRF